MGFEELVDDGGALDDGVLDDGVEAAVADGCDGAHGLGKGTVLVVP